MPPLAKASNTKWSATMSMTATKSFSDDFLTTEQTAVRLGCSAWTLAKWRLKGTGPAWRRIGPQKVVYAVSDVNAFLGKVSA
jgi:hypothetical protein